MEIRARFSLWSCSNDTTSLTRHYTETLRPRCSVRIARFLFNTNWFKNTSHTPSPSSAIISPKRFVVDGCLIARVSKALRESCGYCQRSRLSYWTTPMWLTQVFFVEATSPQSLHPAAFHERGRSSIPSSIWCWWIPRSAIISVLTLPFSPTLVMLMELYLPDLSITSRR